MGRCNLSEQRIRKHLSDLLEASSLGTDWSSGCHTSPIWFAMRTDGGPFVLRARNRRAGWHWRLVTVSNVINPACRVCSPTGDADFARAMIKGRHAPVA